MRIVVTSDVHLDAQTMGVSRFQELADKWADSALENDIDAWFFLGDLCDPDSGPVVFQAVGVAITIADAMRERQIATYWLAGNHDVCNDGHGTTTLSPLLGLEAKGDMGLNVIEYPKLFAPGKKGSPWMLALPYTEPACAYDPAVVVAEATKHAQAKGGEVSLVLSHLSVPGIVPGEETLQMPRGREVMLPVDAIREHMPNALVLQGHYHQRQSLNLDGVRIEVVGSLSRLTFGEARNDPGYLVVDL